MLEVKILKNLGDPCILEDRVCTECGECDVCDLDPTKQCNNCCQCIETLDGDFAEIEIDDIILSSEDQRPARRRSKNQKYKVNRAR